MSVRWFSQWSEYLTHFQVSKSFHALHSLYAATKQNAIMGMKHQELPVNPLSFIVCFDLEEHNLISYLTRLHGAMNNPSFMTLKIITI